VARRRRAEIDGRSGATLVGQDAPELAGVADPDRLAATLAPMTAHQSPS
jgi:hypothetical protein